MKLTEKEYLFRNQGCSIFGKKSIQVSTVAILHDDIYWVGVFAKLFKVWTKNPNKIMRNKLWRCLYFWIDRLINYASSQFYFFYCKRGAIAIVSILIDRSKTTGTNWSLNTSIYEALYNGLKKRIKQSCSSLFLSIDNRPFTYNIYLKNKK